MSLLFCRPDIRWRKLLFSGGWFTWLNGEHVNGSQLPVFDHRAVGIDGRLCDRATVWWIAWTYIQRTNYCLVSATRIHFARSLYDEPQRWRGWKISRRSRKSLQIITTISRIRRWYVRTQTETYSLQSYLSFTVFLTLSLWPLRV
jgi:hypothetical protein